MNLCIEFILINFFVSCLSDILLNYLSRIKVFNLPKPIIALRSYFKHYDNLLLTAVYAGLTIITVLLITMLFSKLVFGFFTPGNKYYLIQFLSLALPLGYIADIFIYKYKVFGNTLDPYYKVAGAGLFGALAFAASIISSYFLLQLQR